MTASTTNDEIDALIQYALTSDLCHDPLVIDLADSLAVAQHPQVKRIALRLSVRCLL